MPPKKLAAPKKKVRIEVKKIDIDGDGIPDGDLVIKYIGDKEVGSKFVASDKMVKIAKKAITQAKIEQENTSTKEKPMKQKIVYKSIPLRPPGSQEATVQAPLQVQEQTSFGQYIKAGAGMTVGSIAVTSLMDGLSGLFS